MAPKKKAAKKQVAKKAAVTAAKPKAVKAPAVKKVAKTATNEPVVKSRKLVKPKSATGTFTQSEFLANLQGFCGIEKKNEAKELVSDILELVTESLKKGYRIPLFGIGRITVSKRKKRKGRNPATGEPMIIPAGKKVKFSATKSFKESVL